MQKVTLLLLFLCLQSFAQQHVYVNAYKRSDGTAVPSHYRTNKDYTVNNNFTTVGNTNPYTGKVGTLPRDNYSPVQSYANTTPTNYSYSAPVSNNSSYKINVTVPLSGGYGVPTIVDQVLENGIWKTLKQDKFNGYLFFEKDFVYFKRGQNKWLGRPQNFVRYDSDAKAYVYNSEYGLVLLDEGLRLIVFYDTDNTKRHVYVIGTKTPTITPN